MCLCLLVCSVTEDFGEVVACVVDFRHATVGIFLLLWLPVIWVVSESEKSVCLSEILLAEVGGKTEDREGFGGG